jgi:hypothetical protein
MRTQYFVWCTQVGRKNCVFEYVIVTNLSQKIEDGKFIIIKKHNFDAKKVGIVLPKHKVSTSEAQIRT